MKNEKKKTFCYLSKLLPNHTRDQGIARHRDHKSRDQNRIAEIIRPQITKLESRES